MLFCRNKIRAEVHFIRHQIDKSTDDNPLLELKLVIYTVACAILNPSMVSICYIVKFLTIRNADQTKWNVTRYADHVKMTDPKDLAKQELEELRIQKFFKKANFGELSEPATILDRHGRIMAWALPNVLHPKRLVG